MLQKIPALPHHLLFTVKNGKQCQALSYNQLTTRLRKWLAVIKEPAQEFSLHSLRRGGAKFAHESRMSEQMIKVLGDWASEAFKRYIDVSGEYRYQSVQAFVDSLNMID